MRARRHQTIARMFRRGSSVPDLAQRYGLTQAEVEQALRRELFPQDFAPKPRRPTAKERRDEAKPLDRCQCGHLRVEHDSGGHCCRIVYPAWGGDGAACACGGFSPAGAQP